MGLGDPQPFFHVFPIPSHGHARLDDAKAHIEEKNHMLQIIQHSNVRRMYLHVGKWW